MSYDLSQAARVALAAMRGTEPEYTEHRNGVTWGIIDLAAAFPNTGATRRSLPGLLSALTRAGVYRQIDGFAWGKVALTA